MSLLDRVQKQQGPDPGLPEGAYVPQAGQGASRPAPQGRMNAVSARARTPFEQTAERVKVRLQARLIEEIDQTEEQNPEQTAVRIVELLDAVVAELGLTMTKLEKQKLQDSVLHDFLGLGPIESLVNDPAITEIMVNGPNQVFVEQKGKLTLSSIQFESDSQLRRVIDRIVSTIGRRID